jgi:Co/Zn/Cd efflux system component
VFVAIEFGYGFIANSTALMADAGHNLSDVLGLVLAWGAALRSARRTAASPTACAARRSWRPCSTPCC